MAPGFIKTWRMRKFKKYMKAPFVCENNLILENTIHEMNFQNTVYFFGKIILPFHCHEVFLEPNNQKQNWITILLFKRTRKSFCKTKRAKTEMKSI